MARKKSGSVDSGSPSQPAGKYFLAEKAPWGGFINIKLDDDHRDAFELWYEAHKDDIWVTFADLLGEQMKVGFSYDSENSCFITTFTGALVVGDVARYCMTTRAGTWAESLALAVWKHEQLAHGDYRDFKPRSGTFKTWG